MATPITMKQFVELAEPGLRAIFQSRLREREPLMKRSKVFTVAGSQRKFEEMLGIGELGVNDWNFEDTRRVQYDSPRKGFKVHVEHKEFAKGMIVERTEIDDNLYGEASELPTSVTGRPRKLADSAMIQRELAAAEVFNHAFTDSGITPQGFQMAGADGVGLCSTAHPLSPEDASVQSNEFTLALTEANIETVRLAMREWTDDRGNLVLISPSQLIVPPELETAALVIQQTIQKPGTELNDVNVVGRRIGSIVSWDYLTDANAWFMTDPGLMSEHLVWFERIALEFASTGDFDTFQAKFRAYMRYSRVWSDWRFIAGSNPS